MRLNFSQYFKYLTNTSYVDIFQLQTVDWLHFAMSLAEKVNNLHIGEIVRYLTDNIMTLVVLTFPIVIDPPYPIKPSFKTSQSCYRIDFCGIETVKCNWKTQTSLLITVVQPSVRYNLVLYNQLNQAFSISNSL